jgi:hypothetical protein
MGNTPLTIGLKINNNNANGGIVAGSMLHGRIYLSNRHNKNKFVHASSIRLKLIGTEEAVVHHQTTETDTGGQQQQQQQNRSYTQDHYERSSDIIYNLDHVIKEFPNGVVPKGQFEFPFALQLPKHLPSSMKAETHQSHCEVRYEIIAEIFQKPNSLLHKNPNSKEPLTIIAMPSNTNNNGQQPTPRTLPTEIIPISNCHCCRCCSCTKIGTMALETRLNTSTLLLDQPSMPHHRGQHGNNFSSPHCHTHNSNHSNNAQKNSFRVEFRCENKSTASFQTARATLTETIEFCVRGHTKTITKTLSSATVETSRYPELESMWRKPFFFEEHKRSNGPEAGLLLRHAPWREVFLGVDASNALDTYTGRAVRVRHVLTLALVTKECCTTNPDACTRVELYRDPSVFGYEQPQQQQPQSQQQSQMQPQSQQEGFAYEKEQQSYKHSTTPTAPFEDEPSFGQAATASTAPSAFYDNNSSTASKVPMVEAQLVLPEDWNAYAEEVVNIPIAEATVVDR